MYSTSVLWLSALVWTGVLAVSPLSPRPRENTIYDCKGPIAFSSTGGKSVLATDIATYKRNVVDLATVSWNHELGVFTCVCPGLYQFSFSGSTEGNTRMVLQKKSNNDKKWSPMLATGPGGGSATILLEIETGDQVAVFLQGHPKKINTRYEQELEVISFSGYRISLVSNPKII